MFRFSTGILLCLTGLLACEESSKTEAKPTATVAPSVAQTAALNPLEFSTPRAFRMALSSTTEVPSQRSKNVLSISGLLWLSSRREGDALRMSAVVESPELLLNGAVEETLGAAVERMEEGASFVFSGGKLERAAFPAGLRPEVANFWRTLAAPLQYDPHPKLEGNSSAIEFDSTGEYEATYVLSADTLTRKKRTYRKVLQSGPKLASIQQLEPKIQTSKTSLSLPDGKLEGLDMDEFVTTDLQPGVSLQVHTQVHLEAIEKTPDEPAPKARLNQLLSARDLTTIPSHEAIALKMEMDHAQFDDLKMKEWTFEDALRAIFAEKQRVAADDASKSDSRKRTFSAYASLAAYLRSRPETLAMAEKKIWAGDPSALSLVGALKMAGTPRAQELMGKVIQEKSLPLELRSLTIVEFSHVKEPIPSAAKWIEPVLSEPPLWEQALLGLGVLGRYYRDAGRQTEFDEISEIITRQLKSVGEGPRRAQALSAVSNLGDARQLDLVRPYLSSDDDRVKRAALAALRHMKTSEVDPLLARALSVETRRNTLLTIISALRLRGPLPIHRQAVASLLLRDDLDGQVRSRALALQASWREGSVVD